MTNYSIWEFPKFQELDSFASALNSNKLTYRKSGPSRGNLTLKNEIGNCETIIKNTILIDSTKVQYLFFNTNVQACTKNIETDEYEIKDVPENIVAYEENNLTKVVILASQTNADRVIRRIFKDEKVWGIIEPSNYVNEDMLYWLFYRLRELSGEQISSNPNLFLNGIVSYLGKTNDKINVVRGIGIRVSALLGTLGMLLGEESLQALRPIIQYGKHEIIIEMGIGNTGKLYEKEYQGPINETDDLLSIALVILVCKFILPSIKEGYDDNVKKKQWSLYIRQTFLRAIGNEMTEKVSKELARIDKELKSEKESSESDSLDLLDEEIDDQCEGDLTELDNEIEGTN